MNEFKYCESCGNQVLKEAVICPKCGRALNNKAVSNTNSESNIPLEYKPISAW